MKIAIVGTHGIGKTTLALEMTAYAKKKGKNAKIVQEVARSCPFPLNEGFSIDGATWIITSQINKELTAKSEKTEIIICDRSSIDPICYLYAGSHNPAVFRKLELFASEWMKTYDKIVWVQPSQIEIVHDGIRSTDVIFQKKVHEAFINFFKDQSDAFDGEVIQIDSAHLMSGKSEILFKEIY